LDFVIFVERCRRSTDGVVVASFVGSLRLVLPVGVGQLSMEEVIHQEMDVVQRKTRTVRFPDPKKAQACESILWIYFWDQSGNVGAYGFE
jgi:hypothetical protein